MNNVFPKIWEYSQPTIDKFVMQRLEDLQRQVEQLKQEINCIKRDKSRKIKFKKLKNTIEL